MLDHSVDTAGVQCGDFHIHTWRRNDSGDRALEKVAQALADGLELPVRSDHEYVADFRRRSRSWARSRSPRQGSVELTSFGGLGPHAGVFPLVRGPRSRSTRGAPKWQTFPTADAPGTRFETLSPPRGVRRRCARAGGAGDHHQPPAGQHELLRLRGLRPGDGAGELRSTDWDTDFTLVEVFNDASWQANRQTARGGLVRVLNAGRHVFAVGSSDGHGLVGTPVGYPRTCIALGPTIRAADADARARSARGGALGGLGAAST